MKACLTRLHRLLPRSLLASCLMLTGFAQAGDTEFIQLSGYDLQAWADARLTPRPLARQALWLAPLANDSATSDERDPPATHSAIERSGVPLTQLDALLAGQLVGSGRYRLIDEDGPVDGLPSLTVRLTRYQPPHRRGDESGLWQRVRSQWSSWVDLDPQPLGVTLTADWHDPLNNTRRHVVIHADSDTCLRLPYAPETASTPAPAAFTDAYRRSAMGQATLATFNRLVGWLDGMQAYDTHALEIIRVRGNRLQLQDPQRLLRTGEELTVFHRDRPAHAIGQLKIASTHAEQIEAWPMTLAAGSVRPGDQVRFHRPASAAVITPATMPPGSHCRAESDAAETGASVHTETQEEASAADDLPQS